MTDVELRDELVTLLLAGPRDHRHRRSRGRSSGWCAIRRSSARLTAEIDAGESDEYLTAVVNETLRVRPVVPIVVRRAHAAAPGGRRASSRPGTRVMPSIYLTNRNPRVYEDPGEFRPERFLQSAPETFSWIPFGGGIRRCIGASFALLEMKLILRTVLGELEPRLPDAAQRGAAASGSAAARSRSCPPRARRSCGSGAARRSEPLAAARGAAAVDSPAGPAAAGAGYRAGDGEAAR